LRLFACILIHHLLLKNKPTHTWSKRIQMNSQIIPFTTGHVDIDANVLNLKLRVQAWRFKK